MWKTEKYRMMPLVHGNPCHDFALLCSHAVIHAGRHYIWTTPPELLCIQVDFISKVFSRKTEDHHMMPLMYGNSSHDFGKL